MKRRCVSAVIRLVLIVLLGAAVGGSLGAARSAATITIQQSGLQFATIQAAIDAAPDGSVIQITAGTYKENLTIKNRSGLTLQGAGQDKSTLDGNGPQQENVTPGILISNSRDISVTGLRITNCRRGLEANNSTGLSIAANRFDANTRQAVLLLSSEGKLDSNAIQGTQIDRDGIHGQGVWLYDAVAVLMSNSIVDNADDGVRANGPLSRISGSSNTIRNNRAGDLSGCVPVTILAQPPAGGTLDQVSVPGDAPTIQAGVDKARAGGTVTVAAGTYKERVQVYRSVTIRGSGQGKTILEAPGPEWIALNIASDQLLVTVEGLTVRGGRRGIQVGTGSGGDVTLRSVAVVDCGAAKGPYDTGVFVFDRAKLTLEDASVSQNHWLGLLTFYNARLTLKHTDVGGNANTGLWTQHDSVVAIEGGSTFAQSGYRAIDATGSSKVTVQDSTVSTSGDAGVVARDDATITLLQAEVSDNSKGGVVAYDRTTMTITGSSITKNTFYGVEAEGSSRTTITNTHITGTPSAASSGSASVGLFLGGNSQTTVTGSTISDNYDTGVWITGSAQATLTGNTIANNSKPMGATPGGILIGIFSSKSTVTVEISGNTITGNGACGVSVNTKAAGIHVTGHGNTISGNNPDLCPPDKFPQAFGGGR